MKSHLYMFEIDMYYCCLQIVGENRPHEKLKKPKRTGMPPADRWERLTSIPSKRCKISQCFANKMKSVPDELVDVLDRDTDGWFDDWINWMKGKVDRESSGSE